MTCKACTSAREHPLSGYFEAGCQGCAARLIARMPEFFVASKESRITPEYRTVLQRLLPNLTQAAAHAAVKEWVK